MSRSAMTLASLETGRSRLYVVPSSRPERVTPPDRVSDAWPDWSTELSDAELAKAARKNRTSVVLREAAGAVVFSVGLVILLMAVLGVLHIG